MLLRYSGYAGPSPLRDASDFQKFRVGRFYISIHRSRRVRTHARLYLESPLSRRDVQSEDFYAKSRVARPIIGVARTDTSPLDRGLSLPATFGLALGIGGVDVRDVFETCLPSRCVSGDEE